MITFRSALVYSFVTRYAALIVQFLATIIIARLLSPTEIGIYSVGAAIIMIAHTLRDFGTSNYIIQERELTDARLRTAFTLTVIVAWSLAGMLWSAAMPLAKFYREPGVGTVLWVMAINFLLIPFGSITLALMRREMNFRALMFINLASTLVQSGLSVLLAALGVGFISLAWGGIGSTVATVIGALMVNRAWVVAWPSLSEHKQVLSFSLRSFLSSIAAEAGHAAPDLVIGRTLGMEANGLFARALGYVLLFERLLQDILRGVMLTYLAGEVRAGADLRVKLFLALEHIGAAALVHNWFAGHSRRPDDSVTLWPAVDRGRAGGADPVSRDGDSLFRANALIRADRHWSDCPGDACGDLVDPGEVSALDRSVTLWSDNGRAGLYPG
ncbi:MAG: oligosaccharide flippase family protein [Chromatiales bacterium]|nr:oligosaccharide flippase family protein [Chromatiales bacterium]